MSRDNWIHYLDQYGRQVARPKWTPEIGELVEVRPWNGETWRDAHVAAEERNYFYLVRLRGFHCVHGALVTVHIDDIRKLSAVDALAKVVPAWCTTCQVVPPVWGKLCRLCWVSALPGRLWRWARA